MLPGPTLVKSCPHCAQLIIQETLVSGNTFGAVSWTDGKQEAPMLPDQPRLVACPHCHETLWIDEIAPVREVRAGREEEDLDGESAAWQEAPTDDDYFDLLAQGLDSKEKELYVRISAWWAGNDARRDARDDIPMSSRERANLEALADLLDESDSGDLIMKAEVMRELDRFDEAQALLDRPVDGGLEGAADVIRRLVASRDSRVRRLEGV